jgi:hypothetical protein
LKTRSVSLGALSTQLMFSILETSSIGHIAYSRLKPGEEGVVHGVFDSAINILFAKGLVSLVPETAQRGPLNITLRLPVGSPKMSSLGIQTGDKVTVQGSVLKLSDRYLVLFGSAMKYSPKHKLTLPMLTDIEIEANLEVITKTALLFGNLAGLGELLALLPLDVDEATTRKLNIFASFALNRIVRLEQAFSSEEREALKDAVRELVGLGPGLTPSSDDMLAGLILLCVLYAKNCECPQHASQLLAQVITEETRGRTTIISEEYLRQAASGRGNEPVVRLCNALLTGERESVELETKRVLATGETSGTDTVLGIVLGTMFCISKQSGLTRRKTE